MIRDIVKSLESQPNVAWTCSEEISRLREYQELEESLGVDSLALMRKARDMATMAKKREESGNDAYSLVENLADELMEKYNIRDIVDGCLCQPTGFDQNSIGMSKMSKGGNQQ